MTAENASGADGGLEAFKGCEAVLAELLARPTGSFEQLFPLGLVLLRVRTQIEREEKVLGVPPDTRAPEFAQQLHALARLRSSLRDVPERDDQIGLAVLQIGERSPESDGVAVHVRDEGDAHSAQLTAAQ